MSHMGFFPAVQHELHATLFDPHLHVYKNLMLRCVVFTCNSSWTWAWRYAPGAWLAFLWSWLASPHTSMLRTVIFTCVSSWTWRCAPWSSLGFLHELGSSLYGLHLRVYMTLMLRSTMIFPRSPTWIWCCSSTWNWCAAAWCSLAFLNELEAALHDRRLHFYMNLLTCCFAPWSSCLFLNELDATLFDIHLRFFMNLILGSLLFPCNPTWTRCYALWPSLACPNELDTEFCGLRLRFFRNLTLRTRIFTCISMILTCVST